MHSGSHGLHAGLRFLTSQHDQVLHRRRRRRRRRHCPQYHYYCRRYRRKDICGEISESFIEAGGKNFLYIPCLNDEKIHIDMLFNIIKNELLGWI